VTAARSKTSACCAPRNHEIDIHPRELLRRNSGTGFHQHFEPHAEASGVELLVQVACARSGRAPHVEIEDTAQLLGCRQRDELAAVLEPTALDDPVKQLGLQSRDDVREMRGVQDAIEQRPVSSVSQRRAVSRQGLLDWLHVTSGNRLVIERLQIAGSPNLTEVYTPR
jgi:hypothetical protein